MRFRPNARLDASQITDKRQVARAAGTIHRQPRPPFKDPLGYSRRMAGSAAWWKLKEMGRR